jgi:hypothetical protein
MARGRSNNWKLVDVHDGWTDPKPQSYGLPPMGGRSGGARGAVAHPESVKKNLGTLWKNKPKRPNFASTLQLSNCIEQKQKRGHATRPIPRRPPALPPLARALDAFFPESICHRSPWLVRRPPLSPAIPAGRHTAAALRGYSRLRSRSSAGQQVRFRTVFNLCLAALELSSHPVSYSFHTL